MDVYSDPLGRCFSSVGVAHLYAVLDLLFSGLKSQPDQKGKDLKLSGETANMYNVLQVV